MKKKMTLLIASALAVPMLAGAQVRMSEEEYVPNRPASVRAPSEPSAGTAVMSQEPTDLGLPIDAADVAVRQSSPFHIRQGVAIHSQIEAWARAKGWQLIWYPSVSWRAIANADFNQHKEVSAAIEDVINILRDEGKPVRLRISEGNHVLEVTSNEVRGDQ